MIKFNTLYKDNMTYPCKLSELYTSLCKQVGLEAGNTNFINNNYMVLGNPFTNNEDCRTVLSNIAQLAGGFAKIGRDNKVYIKSLKNISNLLTVKYVNAMTVKELNLTMVKVLSEEKNNADEKIDGNNYFDDFEKNEQWGELNSLVVSLSSIDGENTTVQDKDNIKENGLTEITIQDNSFLINQEEREKTIVPIWNSLKGIKYLPFKTQYYGYPYIDSGDMIYIQDTKDNGYISYVFNHTFKFNGSFSGNINTPAMTKTQTAYKNTLDIKTKFKMAERSIDKINGKIQDLVEETTENSKKITKHEQDINGITQSVGNVEEKVETVESTANTAKTTAENAQSTANTANTTANTAKSTADTAKKTADNTNDNLTTNYYTKTETNSQITQKAESITSEVSKTYSTKTETSTAKTEAINSANSSTDNKLKGYTETSKLGTAIEQNYEHVKVAWNQISDFIQMMIINKNASLAILDKDKNVMMALDKEGQHFYKDDGTEFGEMGVNTIDNQNYISFGVTGNYGQEISDGMAWGITTKKDNKFWPILYIKNFVMSDENSDGSHGELILDGCNLVLNGLGTGIETGGVFIYGDPSGDIMYFVGKEDNQNFMTIYSDYKYVDSDLQIQHEKRLEFLDNIIFYKNSAGTNTFRIGNDNNAYCLFTDEGSIHCSNIIISDGSNLVSINPNGEVIGHDLNFYGLPSYQGQKLVYGQDGHRYYLDWTGSKLNFWVDTTNVGTLSDKRLKTEIQDIDEDFIKAIEEIEMKQFKVANRNGLISFGILAQDLIEIFKKHGKKPFDYEIVYKTQFRTDDDTVYYAINYEQFLILKQKAMDKKIEQLQEKDKQKDELIQSLIQRIETLEKEVNK